MPPLYSGPVTFDSNGHAWVSCAAPAANPPKLAAVVSPVWQGMSPPGSNGRWLYLAVRVSDCTHMSPPMPPATEWGASLEGPPNATCDVAVVEVSA